VACWAIERRHALVQVVVGGDQLIATGQEGITRQCGRPRHPRRRVCMRVRVSVQVVVVVQWDVAIAHRGVIEPEDVAL